VVFSIKTEKIPAGTDRNGRWSRRCSVNSVSQLL
jgi:hypothetical protein